MATADRAQDEHAIASRIARDDDEAPWLILPRAIADLDGLMADAESDHAAFLQEHRVHLAERLAGAALALNRHGAEADAG